MTDYIISEEQLNELALYFREHQYPHIAKRGGGIISDISSCPLLEALKIERVKITGCIHAKMRAKFTLAVNEIDKFFESLRSEP
jgi:hypothetical protein